MISFTENYNILENSPILRTKIPLTTFQTETLSLTFNPMPVWTYPYTCKRSTSLDSKVIMETDWWTEATTLPPVLTQSVKSVAHLCRLCAASWFSAFVINFIMQVGNIPRNNCRLFWLTKMPCQCRSGYESTELEYIYNTTRQWHSLTEQTQYTNYESFAENISVLVFFEHSSRILLEN